MLSSDEYTVSFASANTDITPSFPVPLSGYAGRTQPFIQVEAPLKAVAVRFVGETSNPILISLDLLYPSASLRNKILAAFEKQVESRDLFLCATHTHYAPSIDRTKPLLGAVDERYENFVFQQVVALVKTVLKKKLRKGTLHYGEQFANHAVNRRLMLQRPIIEKRRIVKGGLRFAPNKTGPKDEKIRVVAVVDNSGLTAAILWNYTCHPVGSPASVELGPDYPGRVRELLGVRYEQQPEIIFLQGFCGDIRPYFFDRKNTLREKARAISKGPSFAPMSTAESLTWSQTLAEKVFSATETAKKHSPLRSAVYVERTEYPLRLLLENAPEERKFSVARLDFGDRLRFLFLSAEPVVAYSDFVRRMSLGRFTFPVGYTDDVFGYIPTKAMLDEGGYEAGQFFQSFSLTGALQPNVEKLVNQSIREIIKEGDHPDRRPKYGITDIEEGLLSLGLKSGDLVLARCGLLAMGQVEGSRTDVFLTALLNVIGPSGTLVGLAFNNCLSLPWSAPKECVTAETVPYTGGFVQRMLNTEGAIRSRHPSNSFVAIGPKAAALLDGHDETAPSFAPMEKFIEWNGKMILVGCVEASPGFSTTHWAQERLGLSYGNIFARLETANFESNGETKTFRRKDLPGCSKGFGKFYSHYIQHEKLSIAYVGDALSYAIDAKAAFDIDYNLLKGNPTYALCDDPKCRHCRGSLTYNAKDMPMYYLREAVRKVISVYEKRISRRG